MKPPPVANPKPVTTRTTMKESFHSKIYESISTFTLTVPLVPLPVIQEGAT